jgi:hypothetical protein
VNFDGSGAAKLAENVRRHVSERGFLITAGLTVALRVHVHVVIVPPHQTSIADLISSGRRAASAASITDNSQIH